MPAPPACGLCTKPVETVSARTACPACLQWYHAPCWAKYNGCLACPAAATRGAPVHDIEVVDEGHELRLVKPRSPVEGLVVAGLGAFLVAAGVFSALRVEGHPLLVGLLVLALLAAGVATLYAGLVLLVNQLEIRASKVRIEVVNGPLPWPGSTTVSLSELEQLYVHEVSEDHYRLTVIRRGRAVELLAMGDRGTLRFIERELERWLGIDDLPVEGEVPRERLPTACPACGRSLGRGVRKAACNTCFAWHHAACWRKERGCSACKKPAGASPTAPAQLPVPAPGGIDVVKEDDEVLMGFAWKEVRPPRISTLLLGLSLPLIFIGLDWALPIPSSTRLIHLFVAPLGLWAVYFFVAGRVNRTSIRVTPRELTVHHGPLPWRGVTLPVSQVERIAREVKTVSGEDGPIDAFYEVVAHLKGGGRVWLVGFVTDRSHADFLVRELEDPLRPK